MKDFATISDLVALLRHLPVLISFAGQKQQALSTFSVFRKYVQGHRRSPAC